MKYLFYFVLILGTFFAALPLVSACSCIAPPPPQTALQEADAVFAGKVTNIQAGDLQSTLVVSFAPSQRWKGPDSSTILVTTTDNSAACGFEFVLDNEYLVYATTPEEETLLSTGLCSRTALLAEAQEDISALGTPQTPSSPEAKDGIGTTFFIVFGIILLVVIIIVVGIRKK